MRLHHTVTAVVAFGLARSAAATLADAIDEIHRLDAASDVARSARLKQAAIRRSAAGRAARGRSVLRVFPG